MKAVAFKSVHQLRLNRKTLVTGLLMRLHNSALSYSHCHIHNLQSTVISRAVSAVGEVCTGRETRHVFSGHG